MEEEKMLGFCNRETAMVALLWENDPHWIIYAKGIAQRNPENGKDLLKEVAEGIYDDFFDNFARNFAAPKKHREFCKTFVRDVGSLWRVSWREVADHFSKE